MTAELDLKKLLAEYEAQDQGHDDLTMVQEGEWEQESKDQYCSTVYRHEPTGRFVEITQNRRGAYWSDWDYGDPDICEVVPRTKTVTVYETVAAATPPSAPDPRTPE
ncbi:hypothetical protein [Variovorax sp. PMC12]|uniref:hypothetical protein n=1 Tax=Variovorax sp. PMC12 TaxID=2126319 RepID=UPI000D128332|nr:hypothetical protein [Variovorax sp. PMC12]AVQ80737.1 hypothetical protein C4F17_07115 [Variovorax sp. PMC12]